MSSARKYRTSYTREDYRHWEGDWELVAGLAVSMSPSPTGPHERAIVELVKSIGVGLDSQESDCRVYAGLDWIVSDDTILRPDLMIVCGEQPEQHLEKPPVLVAEVLSPSTWKLDTGAKREIYHDAGVDVYLIADTDLKQIEIINFKSDITKTIAQNESVQLAIMDAVNLTLNCDKIFR